MAAEPPAITEDLKAAIARVRKKVAESGRNRTKGGPYDPPISEEAGQALIELVRDGSYAAAVARVVADDPDLADQ